jgi:SAM-dependent methyltransferase
MVRRLKKRLGFLSGTPLHPQWLAGAGRSKLIQQLCGIGQGAVVLDIGCSNKWPKKHLPPETTYIGLDYLPTASQWYKTRPDVYADGSVLPIATETINVVLLIDVLEHVAETEGLLGEIHRVLKHKGSLIMQVPFLYPLHDEPRDYIRLTRWGLERLAMKYGFHIDTFTVIGHPCETAALLTNLALSKTMLTWFAARSPACILSIFLPFIILKNNLLGKWIGRTAKVDEFMPYAYETVWQKNANNEFVPIA